jgi:DNA-binding MarR family transcriptional regulator
VAIGRRGPTPDEMTAWRGSLRTHALVVNRLDTELRQRHGIPLDWYDVLVQLHEAGGERTMSELADALLILSPSSCTRLVDRLVAAGLVRREVDSDDARVKHAVLTAEGRAVLRRAAPTHLAGIRRWFTGLLEPGEAAQLSALNARILDRLDRKAND